MTMRLRGGFGRRSGGWIAAALLTVMLAAQAQAQALAAERGSEASVAAAKKAKPAEGAQVAAIVAPAGAVAKDTGLTQSLEPLLLLLCGLTVFLLATGIKLKLSRRVLSESGDLLAPGPQPRPGPSHLDTQMR